MVNEEKKKIGSCNSLVGRRRVYLSKKKKSREKKSRRREGKEGKGKIGNDDIDVCGCRDYDVTVFGGGKIFSLCFEF